MPFTLLFSKDCQVDMLHSCVPFTQFFSKNCQVDRLHSCMPFTQFFSKNGQVDRLHSCMPFTQFFSKNGQVDRLHSSRFRPFSVGVAPPGVRGEMDWKVTIPTTCPPLLSTQPLGPSPPEGCLPTCLLGCTCTSQCWRLILL